MLLKVAEGNRMAFSALYERFSKPLYSLALKMLANEAEAQDLLQEVFLSVWNKAATFRAEKGSAFSWVVSQARNRAIAGLTLIDRSASLWPGPGHRRDRPEISPPRCRCKKCKSMTWLLAICDRRAREWARRSVIGQNGISSSSLL